MQATKKTYQATLRVRKSQARNACRVGANERKSTRNRRLLVRQSPKKKKIACAIGVDHRGEEERGTGLQP